MNDLENEVEAVLISLMQGKATHLNLAARESLARWAGKTALMRQLQSAPSVVIKNNPAYQQVMTDRYRHGVGFLVPESSVLKIRHELEVL
jgi:hypothetical protein